MGVEAGRRHERFRRSHVTRSRSGLRLVDSEEAIGSAIALAREYGAWAVEQARREYGIDARAESERGLSTSIDELLVPRGRLYLVEREGVPVGVGGLKRSRTQSPRSSACTSDPRLAGKGSADGCSDNSSKTHEHWSSGWSVSKAQPSCPKRTRSIEVPDSRSSDRSKTASSPTFRAQRGSKSSWPFRLRSTPDSLACARVRTAEAIACASKGTGLAKRYPLGTG